LIDACQHDRICTCQAIQWFAEAPFRKKSAASPGISCVNRNDIQITCETKMLEPVVKNEAVCMKMLDRIACGGDSICVADYGGDVLQIHREQKGFVASLFGCGKDCLAV
jgi:hypothetical protein